MSGWVMPHGEYRCAHTDTHVHNKNTRTHTNIHTHMYIYTFEAAGSCATRLIHTCDMTHLWLIHMFDITRPWLDDRTHSLGCRFMHDISVCVCVCVCVCVVCVCRESFMRDSFTCDDHVLQCVAVCCSVLQCVAVWHEYVCVCVSRIIYAWLMA